MIRWLRGRAGEWLAASQASWGGSSCWTEEEQNKELREPPWDTAGRTRRFEGKKMQERKEQLEWMLQFCDMGFSRRSCLWRGSLKILTTRVIDHCSLLKRAGKLGDTEGPGWATAPNDTHPSGLFLPVRLHQSLDPPKVHLQLEVSLAAHEPDTEKEGVDSKRPFMCFENAYATWPAHSLPSCLLNKDMFFKHY